MKTISTMKTVKIVLLTMIAGATLVSCSMKPESAAAESAAGPADVKARPVRVMELNKSETAITQDITSTVVAYEETHLSPSLPGRIRRVLVEVNDHVKKGQLLVEMDRTQLDQTVLQYQQLLTDMARMDTLLQYGSITQQSYDQMKSQVETTELIMKNLEENTLLRAPYSGVITAKYYDDGELYSPTPNTPSGKAALISMIQVDPVKLIVNVSETYLPLVRNGMKVNVNTDVYPDVTLQGTVFRIHPTINAASRTFSVEVRVPNKNDKLVPGMFARVSLIMGEKMALLVPSIAVLQVSGTNERYVMLNNNGTAQRVTVKILKRHDDQLEIDSPGIHEGEQLIYAGQSELEDGAKITVVAD